LKHFLISALAAGLLLCASQEASSQQAATAFASAPELGYQAVPNFFKTPR
jgi:hypothetical protein